MKKRKKMKIKNEGEETTQRKSSIRKRGKDSRMTKETRK